ncbi:glycosyltransferase [Streptomyces sp. TLI_171]|uniref:glycosyltransferase n=1 Tax=Streptomyces sp. TLI_171 TaxID=1938859 RepID=UPI000C178857|nr:glycosyltransferase [Streptomyces sp. TLI_171]RKE18238.1 glycosyltransferase involved in cell wall biosynthesis [Streptomyces sp. TLI_171]
MTGRARVLWLAKGLGRGGAEQLLVNCARHADRSRYEIEVAYVLPHKDALVPALEAAGVPVHCLGAAPGRRWPLRLRALLAERGYDLVHTHMPVPAVAARLLAAGRGGPKLVHTEHNLWERYRRPTRWANAWTYRRNSAVIAVSHAVAEGVGRRRPGDWLSVVHHGPDLGDAPSGPAARRAARDELGLPHGALVIGTVGNLTAKKDQATLLAAFERLRREHPTARLVLVGAGPLESALKARAGEGVLFAGSRGDVPALLPGWDVFCLSSRQEGLPVALMEAMTSGLPSVVTRVGGMPEVLDDGVEGRLVPPGDPAALAAALGALAADAEVRGRMGAAARERSKSFDVAGAQQAIERVYARVLAS